MEIMTILKKHRLRALGIGIFGADMLFFGATNPDKVSSLALFAGFALLSATFFYVAWALLALADKSGLPIGDHARKAGLGLAGLTVLLVALQSVGQLGVRDIAVAIPFAVIAYLYITYNESEHSTAS